MIYDFLNISAFNYAQGTATIPREELQANALHLSEEQKSRYVADQDQPLTSSIGTIIQGETVHYYSFGNYNLVRLLVYLLKQTGPAHIFMTSYSFSQKSIEQLQKRIERGEILSFRIIIDNRVKSMSPKPFQMLSTCFDYRCFSIHAKIALIWNDRWNITVITSQNATDNPKMERGVIYTDSKLFEFDLKTLEDAFRRGSA